MNKLDAAEALSWAQTVCDDAGAGAYHESLVDSLNAARTLLAMSAELSTLREDAKRIAAYGASGGRNLTIGADLLGRLKNYAFDNNIDLDDELECAATIRRLFNLAASPAKAAQEALKPHASERLEIIRRIAERGLAISSKFQQTHATDCFQHILNEISVLKKELP